MSEKWEQANMPSGTFQSPFGDLSVSFREAFNWLSSGTAAPFPWREPREGEITVPENRPPPPWECPHETCVPVRAARPGPARRRPRPRHRRGAHHPHGGGHRQDHLPAGEAGGAVGLFQGRGPGGGTAQRILGRAGGGRAAGGRRPGGGWLLRPRHLHAVHGKVGGVPDPVRPGPRGSGAGVRPGPGRAHHGRPEGPGAGGHGPGFIHPVPVTVPGPQVGSPAEPGDLRTGGHRGCVHPGPEPGHHRRRHDHRAHRLAPAGRRPSPGAGGPAHSRGHRPGPGWAVPRPPACTWSPPGWSGTSPKCRSW